MRSRRAMAGVPAEDQDVHGPDLGRGQHGDNGLGQGGHEDEHPVALAHALVAQGVGETVHFAMKLVVGELVAVAGFAFPYEGQLVFVGRGDVAVQGVVHDIALGPCKPLVERRVGIIQNLVPFPEPVQFLGGFFPVAQVVAVGSLEGGLVFLGRDIRLGRHLGQGTEYVLLFLKHCLECAWMNHACLPGVRFESSPVRIGANRGEADRSRSHVVMIRIACRIYVPRGSQFR